MATSKSLTKRLDELAFGQARVVSLRSSANLPAECLTPFLLQQCGASTGVPALVISFSDSPASLVHLAKRVGLNLGKMPHAQLVDGLSLLATHVDSHYPITKQPPFTHTANPVEAIDPPPTSSGILGTILSKIATFAATSPQGTIVISGLEVLHHKLASNATPEAPYFGLIRFLCQILSHKCAKFIIGFDESLKTMEPTAINFLRSTAEIDLRLKGVRSGYTTDYVGTLEIRDSTGRLGKAGTKRLKAVVASGSLDFVDQIKV